MVKCCMTCKYFDYIRVKCEKRKDSKIIPHDSPLPCKSWKDWKDWEAKDEEVSDGKRE